jgi:hypothetical protein
MPANGGLLRIGYRSQATEISRSRSEIADSLFNEPHRPPHHHVHAADRGACGDLEFARSLSARADMARSGPSFLLFVA